MVKQPEKSKRFYTKDGKRKWTKEQIKAFNITAKNDGKIKVFDTKIGRNVQSYDELLKFGSLFKFKTYDKHLVPNIKLKAKNGNVDYLEEEFTPTFRRFIIEEFKRFEEEVIKKYYTKNGKPTNQVHKYRVTLTFNAKSNGESYNFGTDTGYRQLVESILTNLLDKLFLKPDIGVFRKSPNAFVRIISVGLTLGFQEKTTTKDVNNMSNYVNDTYLDIIKRIIRDEKRKQVEVLPKMPKIKKEKESKKIIENLDKLYVESIKPIQKLLEDKKEEARKKRAIEYEKTLALRKQIKKEKLKQINEDRKIGRKFIKMEKLKQKIKEYRERIGKNRTKQKLENIREKRYIRKPKVV